MKRYNLLQSRNILKKIEFQESLKAICRINEYYKSKTIVLFQYLEFQFPRTHLLLQV